MLARLLRIGAGIELLGAVVIGAALLHWGAPAWVAVLAGAALPLMVHGVPLAIEFATGAAIDRRPVARLGPLALGRVWLGETWRSFKVFNIDQAWRAGFPEPAVVHDPLRPAVLFIHGYMCNRATWRPWLFGRGLAQRWNCATVNLEPVFGPVDRYPERIDEAVERLRAASGAARVTLVCHSMGGLAARVYLRRHGDAHVARVVTLATPHHGTVFGRLGHSRNARQMARDSPFVEHLRRDDHGRWSRFTTVATRDDNLVVPRSSPLLPGAKQVQIDGVAHLALIEDRRAWQVIVDEVRSAFAQPAPERSAATGSERAASGLVERV